MIEMSVKKLALAFSGLATGLHHLMTPGIENRLVVVLLDCVSESERRCCVFSFSPRACGMRMTRLLTSLWGRLTQQSLCLTAADGPERWWCIHNPLWCDHQCHCFCWGYATNCPYAFVLVFSLEEWAGHKTPPECCRRRSTPEWQFKELKALRKLTELFQRSLLS